MSEPAQPSDPSVLQSRRDFVKLGLLTGVSAALGATALTGCAAAGPRLGPAPAERLVAPRLERVRIGFVGVGWRGTDHVANLLKVPGVEIRAICDILPERVANNQAVVEKAGQPRPIGYDRGPEDFRRLCQQADVDLVFTATPWEWHVPVCVAAMEAGKHAATEVPAAMTVDECWQLVETSEKTHRHCVMVENCCYDRAEMMVLNMVRKGLFGEMLHAECGYLHDLRSYQFLPEKAWILAHSRTGNCNEYPTHGLGPVAQCMNINRGDRLDYLSSMGTPALGLQLWAQEHLPASDPRRNDKYTLGDVNTTIIRTAKGRTIVVGFSINAPRPYSRVFMVEGTRAVYMGYPDRIYIEGRSPEDEFESPEKYKAEFDHPMWKSETIRKASGNNVGMDYLVIYRLVECLRTGQPMDMDVYDAAAWSCISDLSGRSVANRGKSMDIPDFTRGRWETTAPLGIIEE